MSFYPAEMHRSSIPHLEVVTYGTDRFGDMHMGGVLT
jgi:hypothetical protein